GGDRRGPSGAHLVESITTRADRKLQRDAGAGERGLVVDQRLAARDKLALRVEHVEQRRQPFAVERVRLFERGLAFLDRFLQRGIALAVGVDRDERVLGLAQREEEGLAVFGVRRVQLRLGRGDFGPAATAVEQRQV